jgi:hypothetical protein
VRVRDRGFPGGTYLYVVTVSGSLATLVQSSGMVVSSSGLRSMTSVAGEVVGSVRGRGVTDESEVERCQPA